MSFIPSQQQCDGGLPSEPKRKMSHGRLRQRPWGETPLLTVEAPPPWEWCSARFAPEADVLERWQICPNSPQNWCFYRSRNFQRPHGEDDIKSVLSTEPVVLPAEAALQDLRLSSVHEEIAEKSFWMAELMVLVREMPAELPDNQTTKAQFCRWCISVEWVMKPGSFRPFGRDDPEMSHEWLHSPLSALWCFSAKANKQRWMTLLFFLLVNNGDKCGYSSSLSHSLLVLLTHRHTGWFLPGCPWASSLHRG